MFSESREDNPEVGSSTNKTAGSRISSKAIFKRFLCPPLMVLSSGLPTCKFLASNKPRERKVSLTLSIIVGLSRLPKHRFAL